MNKGIASAPVPAYDPHTEACEAWDFIIRDVAYLQSGPVRRVLESDRGQSYGLPATDILDRVNLLAYNATALRQALEALIREGR